MKKSVSWVVTVAGALLIAAGFIMLKQITAPQGVMLVLPYICIGIGCGAFGHGVGNAISQKAQEKDPALKKRLQIDEKDERNVAIANKAKGRAYDIFVYVFGALMLSFALMGAELYVVLMLVFAYLFVVGCGIYYRCKYEKEM